MLKLVGTTISRRKALNFCTLVPPIDTSGLFRIRLNSADADVAREALVDDLHRGHAPTDDALLARDVVGADAAILLLLVLELLALAGDALQQCVDFVLRKDLLIVACV